MEDGFSPFFASKIARFGSQNTSPSCGLRFAAANISPISPLLAENVRIQSLIGLYTESRPKRVPA